MLFDPKFILVLKKSYICKCTIQCIWKLFPPEINSNKKNPQIIKVKFYLIKVKFIFTIFNLKKNLNKNNIAQFILVFYFI
jgi:hypothetical protein